MHELWFGWWQDADGVVRTVFMLLLLVSLLSWSIILYKAVQLSTLVHRMRTCYLVCQQGKMDASHPDLALYQPLLDFYQRNPSAQHSDQERLLGQLLKTRRLHLENGLSFLASVSAAAPFIGLLGTVWGIMHALQGLGSENSASLALVAGPVAEALVATALGLFAAIPALLGYNLLVRLLKRLMGYVEGIGIYVMLSMRQGLRP
ncbi:outer membrane transport energization protein ExbB [Magnetococcus marinus MC-1]|uniref:Outer membrane transport energization protein ExbB n=1 Tax=Magnetococcus marinus (strain ATCC BAA-1437 / JCM 17883 / MC-1) TaxID=156889 RepID=A0LDK4_MAGMM|nr:MotA/TolQ/ExbB proton channel family protein [Magnetococcus marinus]ABK46047.1 outer membrane transport energization protein ExbB [Magnetococcus marinus MC-1]